eukprot:CAMPEP_0175485504 /NCGR_PEP_ID=MMETSP0095-20121207/80551_1 /TAXON_ID=311494 /ORGANISM="Alexandrium monilatum, Strain CCMP3105" /LENGTH=366 /DNA_ID=CAMNT_0016787273 /DNA_START=81 /DNA_END=1178 /DNA_ORIENTATION=+
MWRWLMGSPQTRQEPEQVNADEDPYDPAKPEYLIPASVEEVEAGNLQLLESQITRLEDALAKRQATLDPELAQHYNSVLLEMYSSRTGEQLLSSRHYRTRSTPVLGEVHCTEERCRHLRRQSMPPLSGNATCPDPFSDWDGERGGAELECAHSRKLTVETVVHEVEAPPGWESESEAGEEPASGEGAEVLEDGAQEEPACLGSGEVVGARAKEEQVPAGTDRVMEPAPVATHDVAEVAPNSDHTKNCDKGAECKDQDAWGCFVAYEGALELEGAEQGGQSYQGNENWGAAWQTLRHQRDEPPLLTPEEGVVLPESDSEVHKETSAGDAKEYNKVDCYDEFARTLEKVQALEAETAATLASTVLSPV